MNLIQFKTMTPRRRNSIITQSAGLLTVLVCFAFSPTPNAFGVTATAPDGGYPGYNTAEGQMRSYSLTAGRIANTTSGALCALYEQPATTIRPMALGALKATQPASEHSQWLSSALLQHNRRQQHSQRSRCAPEQHSRRSQHRQRSLCARNNTGGSSTPPTVVKRSRATQTG